MHRFATREPQPRGAWDAARGEFADLRRVRAAPVAEPVALRGYQEEAVRAAHDAASDRFRPGVVVMGCGLGKTIVGARLVELSRAPAVVVTQHAASVRQWVAHLRDRVGLRRVVEGDTMRSSWGIKDPLPDALVLTYTALVGALRTCSEHARRMAAGGAASQDAADVHLVLVLLLERFGVLVLDEVHVAVADHFVLATTLRASVIYGLSGSLVREDERIEELRGVVGDVLFRHNETRKVGIEVWTVPLAAELRERLGPLTRHSCLEEAMRALNPSKVGALFQVLREEADAPVIVFCDSRAALAALARCDALRHAICIHGGVTDAPRQRALEAFAAQRAGVLLSTRVCDAAIDFKPGCRIVQMHVASGSRQQEMQRCGRGLRGGAVSRVVHLVNEGTCEAEYVDRRVQHLAASFQAASVLRRRVCAEPVPIAYEVAPRQTSKKRKHATGAVAMPDDAAAGPSDDARQKLRAKLRLKRGQRSRGAAPSTASQRESAVMQLAGDDPALLSAATAAMRGKLDLSAVKKLTPPAPPPPPPSADESDEEAPPGV